MSTEAYFRNESAEEFVSERKDLVLRAWRDAEQTSGRRDIAVFLLHPDDPTAQAFLAPQRTALERPMAVTIPLAEAIAWLKRVGEYESAQRFEQVAVYPNVGFVALAYDSICVGAWRGGARGFD